MMSIPYQLSYLFENQHTLIIKIRLNSQAIKTEDQDLEHWLHYDKLTSALIKLWPRSTDSAGEIEECFFEQGYLKFNHKEVTYIEKFNSAQHNLYNLSERIPSEQCVRVIENYLK